MNKYKHLSKQARKLRSQFKMCLSKKAYATLEEAFQKGQKVYRCRYCGKWHRSGQFGRFLNELRRKG